MWIKRYLWIDKSYSLMQHLLRNETMWHKTARIDKLPLLIPMVALLFLFIGCGGGTGNITGSENNQTQAEANTEENAELSSSITSPSGNVIMVQGQSLSLQATASGGKTPYTYLWFFEGEAPFSNIEDPGTIPFNTVGSHILNYMANDAAGYTSEDSRLITVLEDETQDGPFDADSIPTLTITSPSGGTFNVGETVAFHALLYNGDVPLIYSWSIGLGNSLSKGSEEVAYISPRTYLITQGITLTTPGTYSIVVSVQDTNTGGRFPDTHTASMLVTVQ
jgi:hypothetical protein